MATAAPAAVMIMTTMASTAATMYAQSKQASAASKAANAAAQRQYEKDKLEYDRKQKTMADKLRRDQAAQRARMGASGMDAHSGSSSAILKGLQKAHDEEKAYLAKNFQFDQEDKRNSLLQTTSEAGQKNPMLQAGVGLFNQGLKSLVR